MRKRRLTFLALAFLALVVLALLPRIGAVHADGDTPAVWNLKQELRHTKALSERYARLLSACFNGQTLYIGDDMVFCDRYTVLIAK
jgi:hypothetical protein